MGNLIHFTEGCTLKHKEHITLLNEPCGEFVSHAVADGHRALGIFNAIENICKYDLKDIKVIGADGTDMNTGRHNGVLSLI